MRPASVMRSKLVKASDYFSRMTIYLQGQVCHQRFYHAWVKTDQVCSFLDESFCYGLTNSVCALRLT